MIYLSLLVRTERLELSHLSAPEPKSGASTNFATSAWELDDYTDFVFLCKALGVIVEAYALQR